MSSSISKAVDTALLTVSGNATVGGDLTISGNVIGNVVGTINPSFTLGSIPFQGATGLAEDNANLFWDDTNKRLGVGTGMPSSTLDVVGPGARLVVNNTSGPSGGNGGSLNLLSGTTTPLLTSHRLGYLIFSGYNGSANTVGGAIEVVASENWGVGLTGSYMSFQTTNIGSTGRSEKVRITSNGLVGIGTTAPDKKLEINLGTADALRLTYNDANGSATTYMDTTISSAGLTTFTGAGSSPSFAFANPLSVATSLTSPLILGGTSTTQDLTFQTTSGVGATGADMHFLVGNNGATEAMTILNNGQILFTNGSVSAPSIARADASTTGLYWSATNRLDVAVSGKNVAEFTTGVAGAGAILQLNLTDFSTGSSTINFDAGNAHIITTGTSPNKDLNFRTYGGNLVLNPGGLNSAAKAVIIKPAANLTTAFQAQQADGTVILNVDSTNARVGIGTAAPASLLSVGASNQFQVTSTGDVNWAETVAPTVQINTKTSDTATGVLTIQGQNAYSSAVTNTTGGNVLVRAGDSTTTGIAGNVVIRGGSSTSWTNTGMVDFSVGYNGTYGTGVRIAFDGYGGNPVIAAYGAANSLVISPSITNPTNSVVAIGAGVLSGYGGGPSATNDFENSAFLKIVKRSGQHYIVPGALSTLTIKSGSGNAGTSTIGGQSGQTLTLQGGDAPVSAYSAIPTLAGTGGDSLLKGGDGGLSQDSSTRGNGGNVYIRGGKLNVTGTGGTVGNVILAHDGTTAVGLVGIGITPTYALDVLATGTGVIARFNSTNSTGCTLADGGTITCTSDERMKKNIEDITYGLETLRGLRPILFNWNYEDPSNTSGQAEKNLGFIAQEVEALVPKLIAIDENGMKSLNTVAMVPILTKAIQEMDLQITDIQNFEKPNTWRDSIVAWFANAENSITRIFTGEVCLTEAGQETVCLNRVELESLKALLINQNQNPEPAPEPTPTEEPISEPVVTEEPVVVEETPIVVEPTPEI